MKGFTRPPRAVLLTLMALSLIGSGRAMEQQEPAAPSAA
jgi:hypothetical protein